MLITQSSTISQTLNRYDLTLAIVFLFTVPIISHAENSNSMDVPVTENQGAPAQEMTGEEIPDTQPMEAKNPGEVARAIFTSEIIDREPTDDLTEMSNSSERIYYFTDLRNLAGQIITHRWEYNDAIMAEVKFKVGNGSRWRVYSSKNLLPEWTGVWTVIVTDENERVLNTSVFNYSQAIEEADNTATSDATTEQNQPVPQ